MNKLFIIAIASAVFLAALTHSSMAFDHYDHDHWHGSDIHHFHEYDAEVWHHGGWVNQFHDGRMGWWWVAGGSWYYYPAPVYPYPDPFLPPGVVVTQAATPQYWYCASPSGYYPYVPQCAVQWQAVAATAPQPVVVQPQPQPVAPSTSTRDMDDRQLNAFAVELEGIHTGDKGALGHLENLKSRVETYRQSLFQRDYNAMDILHDTEGLEKRIDKKIADVEG